MAFEIEFYSSEDGREPVAEFLDSLDSKMSAKLVGLMEILEEKGTELRMPYSKHLEDGIFELRCKQGSNITKGANMNLKEYKTKKMNDPEFAKAYEEIQPEMNVIRAIIDARISQNMTQKELAERTGIAQTEISKLENGTRNPSIKLLQRLAEGMDMVLNISFTPKASVRK